MLEIKGNLWDFFGKENYVICITTNGCVKTNRKAVMGKGCAAEAAARFPFLARRLGDLVLNVGNKVHDLFPKSMVMLSFPVKHNWWEKADLDLIRESSTRLQQIANEYSKRIFILPRPGCSNGRLNWEDVKPILINMSNNIWVISK